jgi:hypothetical protein
MSTMKGSKTEKGRTTQPHGDGAAVTAERLAVLLEAVETPAAVRETIYTYTVLSLWYEYVDETQPRPRKPPQGRALGAWARTYLPALLVRAHGDRLRVAGVPTMPTFKRG